MTDTTQVRPSALPEDGVLLSIVYSSVATVAFSEMDLALLLATSRSNNEARGLSGLLLHRAGRFMQAIEGPEPVVRRVLETIAADPRHDEIRLLHEEVVPERRFGSWSMGYRAVSEADAASAPAWFGSPDAFEHRDPSRTEELLSWFRDR